jgi:hypothetical protein
MKCSLYFLLFNLLDRLFGKLLDHLRGAHDISQKHINIFFVGHLSAETVDEYGLADVQNIFSIRSVRDKYLSCVRHHYLLEDGRDKVDHSHIETN